MQADRAQRTGPLAGVRVLDSSAVVLGPLATQPSRPMRMGPRELGEFRLREYRRLKKVAEAAGIRPE